MPSRMDMREGDVCMHVTSQLTKLNLHTFFERFEITIGIDKQRQHLHGARHGGLAVTARWLVFERKIVAHPALTSFLRTKPNEGIFLHWFLQGLFSKIHDESPFPI